MIKNKKYLDEEGLQLLWNKLNDENSVIMKKINKLTVDVNAANAEIFCDTKENWASQSILIPKKGTIYIYSNYKQDLSKDVAGIKIGDGNSYLADLPFIDTLYSQHIENQDIHVTIQDKNKWNEKVTIDESSVDSELLIFTNK